MRGAINKILKHSSVDGPGNRMVIFFQGCNFSCSYCHNPETINICNNCGLCIMHCHTNALTFNQNKVCWDEVECDQCEKCTQICPHYSSPKTQLYTVQDIVQQIDKVKPFISGITISGGECTLQFDFLKALLIKCKENNISAFIDTNAHLDFVKMKELSLYFDKAMPDVKLIDNKQHSELTGKSSEMVFQNLKYLLSVNKVHEVRTVIYPEYDFTETIKKVSQLISSINEKVTYKLIKYRPLGVKNANCVSSPTDDEMMNFKELAEKEGCTNVTIT